MEISNENGDDTGLESSMGFSISEPLVFGPPTQRYVTIASLDKDKSKMIVPKKLLVKRTQIISV